MSTTLNPYTRAQSDSNALASAREAKALAFDFISTDHDWYVTHPRAIQPLSNDAELTIDAKGNVTDKSVILHYTSFLGWIKDDHGNVWAVDGFNNALTPTELATLVRQDMNRLLLNGSLRKLPSDTTIRAWISQLMAAAEEALATRAPVTPLHRFGYVADTFWIETTDGYLAIEGDHVWSPPVCSVPVRSSDGAALPWVPDEMVAPMIEQASENGSVDWLDELVSRLRSHLALSDEDIALVVGWVITSFIGGDNAILNFRGPAGSRKTSAMRVARALADPRSYESLTTSVSRKEDLPTILANSRVAAFDNLSKISHEDSDILARAVTGDALETRELYTTGGIRTMPIRTSITMTAISLGVIAGDLADRMVTVDMERSDSFKDSKRVAEDLMSALPELHAILFELLAQVITTLPTVSDSVNVRLATFGRVLVALDRLSDNRFSLLSNFREKLRTQKVESVEGSSVASAMVELIDRQGTFDGTPTELLHALSLTSHGGWIMDQSYTPTGLGVALSRSEEALKSAYSITITRKRSSRGSRLVITKN